MGDKDEGIKMGIMVDGEFQEIKEIPSLALGGIISDNCQFGGCGDTPELVGAFKIKKSKRMRAFMKWLSKYKPIQSTNNYRKRHGMPMRRRV